MLSAMQALPGSEGLRNGALADWEAMSRCLNATNDCMVSGQAPDKALRNKGAWSKAVDGCITATLECCPSAVQAAISRSDAALLSSIGKSLAYCLCIAHSCLLDRPAWLHLPHRPHGLQQTVDALVSVVQRYAAPLQVSENTVLVGLSAAISLNALLPPAGTRLGEGLLVDLHCAHLKVSYSLPMHPCMHAGMHISRQADIHIPVPVVDRRDRN